jgi:hypothetical protein
MGAGAVFYASIRDSEQTTSNLSTERVSEFCSPVVAMPLQSYSQPFSMPLPLHNTWKRFMSMRKVCLEERHASLAGTYIGMHFSQARISYRHTSLLGICTSLLDAHFSLACISQDVRISWACLFRGHASQKPASYRGVYFTGRAS